MIYKIEDYYNAINAFAPFSSAVSWDNVGVLAGSPKSAVTAALVTLDMTADSLDEAKAIGADLIITHHPVIYPYLKRIDGESLLFRAICENIAVISAHTNFDLAETGVNDTLARILELDDVHILDSGELPGLARIGKLKSAMRPDEFASLVKSRLNANCVKYTTGIIITDVAIGGGSCAELWKDALAAGAQAFVTSEVKHHFFLSARHVGFTLIDAGHYSTEVIAMSSLAEQLLKALPDARIILQSQKDPACYA